ncbi:MAG: EF-hand domain-containing protein [Luteolibacter sp.]
MKLLGLSLVIASVGCSSGPGPVVPKTRTERQMIGLLQKFDRWDEDGDGYLTASELKPVKKLGHKPAEVIAFYDTNKDGKISLREAQAGYARSDEAEQIIKAGN